MDSFDLTSQPWLPVLRTDGEVAELSLSEVFLQAGRIRRLVGDLPTQEFALLRLLLAILHDAVDGPSNDDAWRALWGADEPFTRIPGYLERHRSRFDLLHPQTPFFQVADLHTAKREVSSLNRLVADVPNGAPFLTMRLPGVGRLTYAEAARWVVHAHAFDFSGIKSGAVGDPQVKNGRGYPQGVAWAGNLGGVQAEGNTLRETLLLNLIAADFDGLADWRDDLPAWRRPPCGPGAASPLELARRPGGPRDLYTWQSRRLRLHHDGRGVYGVVLCYGDPLAPSDGMHRWEPMSAWRRSKPQEKKLGRNLVYMPLPHDPARAAWRGLDSLLPKRDVPAKPGEPDERRAPPLMHWLMHLRHCSLIPGDRMVRVRTVGAVYGTQQSVIDEVLDDSVSMSVALLDERDPQARATAVDAVADADAAVGVVADLVRNLAAASGAEPRPDEVRDRAYGQLDEPFRQWLARLGPDSDLDVARENWRQEVYGIVSALGRELLASAGSAAREGRVIVRHRGTTETRMWMDTGRADLLFFDDLRKKLGREDRPAA